MNVSSFVLYFTFVKTQFAARICCCCCCCIRMMESSSYLYSLKITDHSARISRPVLFIGFDVLHLENLATNSITNLAIIHRSTLPIVSLAKQFYSTRDTGLCNQKQSLTLYCRAVKVVLPSFLYKIMLPLFSGPRTQATLKLFFHQKLFRVPKVLKVYDDDDDDDTRQNYFSKLTSNVIYLILATQIYQSFRLPQSSQNQVRLPSNICRLIFQPIENSVLSYFGITQSTTFVFGDFYNVT